MKLLVTGGAGRIGAYVVAELAGAGHEVVAFDRVRPATPAAGVRYRIGDHEDLAQVVELWPGMDAIAHLSAIPSPADLPERHRLPHQRHGHLQRPRGGGAGRRAPGRLHQQPERLRLRLAAPPVLVRSTSPWTRPTPISPRMPTACPRWWARRSPTASTGAATCGCAASARPGSCSRKKTTAPDALAAPPGWRPPTGDVERNALRLRRRARPGRGLPPGRRGAGGSHSRTRC